MRTNPKKSIAPIRRILRRYRSGGVVCALIITIWGISAAYAWHHFSDQQEAKTATSRQQLERIDQTIARLEGEKEEQRKLKEEKKAKETAEAEAREKAKAEQEAQKAPGSSSPAPSGTESGSCNRASTHITPSAIDVMVNKKHCLRPLDFIPPDLVTTHGGAIISAKAAADFNRMFADAAAAGQPLTVSSSYRSYGTQVSTYNYWVSVNGQAGADTVSARPGFSEHQTGLAVDVAAAGCVLDCFGGTSQYRWLQANAANYGFIQRYYSGYEHITGYASEEWHYRYVGVAAAKDMKAKNIRTLEQYWDMEGGDYR